MLPRFELEWELVLNDALIELGYGRRIRRRRRFPADVIDRAGSEQRRAQTYIRVDEEGTEAAAVTTADMVGSAPVEPMVFRVDRPFVFTISDAETGTILFLGTVVDPRG